VASLPPSLHPTLVNVGSSSSTQKFDGAASPAEAGSDGSTHGSLSGAALPDQPALPLHPCAGASSLLRAAQGGVARFECVIWSAAMHCPAGVLPQSDTRLVPGVLPQNDAHLSAAPRLHRRRPALEQPNTGARTGCRSRRR